MQNAIFSSATESFMVAHIIHVGPVIEIARDKQKNGNTHFFRLTTVQGAAYCKFKNEESARRSRGMLGSMLGTVKPHLFRTKGDSIDLSGIVSFGRVVELKNSSETDAFGLPITLSVFDEKGKTIWITFKTEESGQNVRKALWAALMSFYRPESVPDASTSPAKALESAENSAVEAEVAFVEV